MVTGIPKITLKTSEEFINPADGNQDTLFAICTPATRGPVLTPTTVSSKLEAERIFGLSFEPHFAQGKSQLVVCRIAPGATDSSNVEKVMKPSSRTFYAGTATSDSSGKTIQTVLRKYDESTTGITAKPTKAAASATAAQDAECQKLFTIKSKYPGRSAIDNIEITYSKVYKAYTLSITLDGLGTYINRSHKKIVDVATDIYENFSDYYTIDKKADGSLDVTEPTMKKAVDVAPAQPDESYTWKTEDVSENFAVFSGNLKDGSTTLINIQTFLQDASDYTAQDHNDYQGSILGSNGCLGYYEANVFTPLSDFDVDLEDGVTGTKTDVIANPKIRVNPTGAIGNDITNPINIYGWAETDKNKYPSRNDTASQAYEVALKTLETKDLFGVVVNEDSVNARAMLHQHIIDMNSADNNMVRLGCTSLLSEDTYGDSTSTKPSSGEYKQVLTVDTRSKTVETELVYKYYQKNCTPAKIIAPAKALNDAYMMYIGHGVKFKTQDKEELELDPLQCVQLYTGLRSANLKYHNSIFGGESKKILKNVINIRPLDQGAIYNPPSKADYIKLNEAGVLAFKREYDNITFVEGVTTQQSTGPLQYENIMAIVIYTNKQLIKICRGYQGQNMSDDLRASLQAALEEALETIRQTDHSLVAIENYNKPPYSVEVVMGAFVEFDDYGELQRQNKISVTAKIIPVGALREVELGVIII